MATVVYALILQRRPHRAHGAYRLIARAHDDAPEAAGIRVSLLVSSVALGAVEDTSAFAPPLPVRNRRNPNGNCSD